MQIIAILVFFLFCVLISFFSKYQRNEDFLRDKKGYSALLIALSTLATNHSAFIYLGQIGFTYVYGVKTLYLAAAWKLGDLIGMFWLQKKIKTLIDQQEIHTITQLIDSDKSIRLHQIVGVIAALGLMFYASAQYGSLVKTIQYFGGFNIFYLMLLIVFSVGLYVYRGGFGATILTDSIQFVLIFLSLVILSIEILFFRSTTSLVSSFHAVEFSDFQFGGALGLFIMQVGWFMGGFGTVAQPQVLMRFMAAKNQKNLVKSQYLYVFLSLCTTFLVLFLGLASRALSGYGLSDPEIALFSLASNSQYANILLIVLAIGILSSIMSTLDSLVLSSTSIIHNDVLRTLHLKRRWSPRKISILLLIASLPMWFMGTRYIFSQVLSAWTILVLLYLPIILIKLFRSHPYGWKDFYVFLFALAVFVLIRGFGFNQYVADIILPFMIGSVFWFAPILTKKL